MSSRAGYRRTRVVGSVDFPSLLGGGQSDSAAECATYPRDQQSSHDDSLREEGAKKRLEAENTSPPPIAL